MSLDRILTMLRKDAARGPRSPFFLWVLLFPLLITLVVQLAFGALDSDAPTIAVLAPDDAIALRALQEHRGVHVRRVADPADLDRLLDDGQADMAWRIPSDFEPALRRGERPHLQLKIAGAALASDRILLALAAADAIRRVEGLEPPIQVDLAAPGEAAQRPLRVRLLPLVVLLSILITGIFLPALSLIDERQKGVLSAIFVTPTTTGELLLAKGLLGFILAVAAGCLTLALSGAFPPAPGPILLVLALAGLMVSELGLILGALAKTTTAMFTVWKGSAWFLALPVLGFVWSGAPSWLGPLSPTYWFISPTWKITVEGQSLRQVAPELAVALLWILALFPLVLWAGRRARRTIGEG